MNHTIRTTLAGTALLALALTGCGSDHNDDNHRSSASASASTTPAPMTNTGHWTGTKNQVKINVTTSAQAPEALASLWKQAKMPAPNILAVEIDNRAGSSSLDLSSAQFIDTNGTTSDYGSLDTFLESEQSSTVENDTDLYNALVDVHNQYTPNDGNNTIPAGAKKTLLLGTKTAPGKKITHATLSLNSTTSGNANTGTSASSSDGALEVPLKPADGAGPTAPAPSTSPTAAEATAPAPETTEPATEETAPTTEETPTEEASEAPAPQQTYDNPSPDENLGTEEPPPGPDYEGDPAGSTDGSSSGLTREQCAAADPATAPSSVYQGCFMDYGIRVGGH